MPDSPPLEILLRERFEPIEVRLRAVALDLLDLKAHVGTEKVLSALPAITSAYSSVQDALRSLSFAQATTTRYTVEKLVEALPGYEDAK